MKAPVRIVKHSILGAVFFLISSCSKPWQETIRYGDLAKPEFSETIPFENKLDLAIVKVKIEGETYDFLFDTGAPLTISKTIQAKANYKVLSSGGFRDSDNQRTYVDYVKVPSVYIGEQEFVNQTAVVADFENNPLIKCLNIQGILGSNLMRHCNWTIDFSDNTIKLFTSQPVFDPSQHYELAFKASDQYDAKIDFNIGKAKLTNIKLDYGSNGPISVPNKIYNTLIEREIVETMAVRKGYSQSGLLGKAVEKDRAYAMADSVLLGELLQSDVIIRSGSSGLLGTRVLAKHRVTIDWNNRRLIFDPHPEIESPRKSLGVQLSINGDNQVYVLSVLEDSEAWNKGVRGGQMVDFWDSITFKSAEDYCEYAFTNVDDKSSVTLGIIDSTQSIKKISLTPFDIKALK